MASATFCGSFLSSAGGALLVLMAQKRQPRVHVSPINMIVAVAEAQAETQCSDASQSHSETSTVEQSQTIAMTSTG
jgi:hypothetical protein